MPGDKIPDYQANLGRFSSQRQKIKYKGKENSCW